MQIGYITNGFSHHRLEEALEILAELGCRSVGLTLDVNHLDPFHSTPAQVRAVGRLLARLRMTPVIETGGRFVLDPRRKHFPNLCSPRAADRARRIVFYKRCIHIGEMLGAKVLSLWSGCVEGRGRAAQQAAFEHVSTGLNYVCRAAARHGLVVGFEPEPGMRIATTVDYDRLVAAVTHPALKLTMDLGHLHCLGETDYAGIFRKYRDRLVNIHIEDMRAGVHEHLMFGAGEMKFKPILRALVQSGYRGPLNIELSRHSVTAVESATAAVRFLRKQLKAAT